MEAVRRCIKKLNCPSNQGGTALTEFAIVLPFLVLLVFGILETGRTLSQISWIAQGSYEAAVVGGERLRGVGAPAMDNMKVLFEDILDLQDNVLGFDFHDEKYQRIPNGGEDVDVIVSHLTGDLRPFSGMFSLDISIRTVGPDIASTLPDPGPLTEFENEEFFDCEGVLCDPDPHTPCVFTPCDGSLPFDFGTLPREPDLY